jgi:hypothetical protein
VKATFTARPELSQYSNNARMSKKPIKRYLLTQKREPAETRHGDQTNNNNWTPQEPQQQQDEHCLLTDRGRRHGKDHVDLAIVDVVVAIRRA